MSSGGLSDRDLDEYLRSFDERMNWELNKIQQKQTPPPYYDYVQFNKFSGYSPSKDSITIDRPMAARKFKKDDRVYLLNGTSHMPDGTEGVIISYDGGSVYGVDFSVTLSPSDCQAYGLHNLDGRIALRSGYWVDSRHLALVNGGQEAVVVDFDSVVMPDSHRQQIREVLEQYNQRDLIFKDWGFASTVEKGRGISILFYGPPGTGKTLAAQAIADKLNRQLKVIANADIASSEPGAAERTIRDTFKFAKPDKTILLFDECDSLIYDRTAVGAILGAQVNELLSSLEKFDGITIFTTNRIETLDEAVNRRLALKLEFAMPDHGARVEIWKRMIPDKCPVEDDINFEQLATVEIAGGFIKNAVLRAARIAAAEDMPNEQKKLAHKHLIRALKEEGESMLAFKKAKADFNPVREVGPGISITENAGLSIRSFGGHDHG